MLDAVMDSHILIHIIVLAVGAIAATTTSLSQSSATAVSQYACNASVANLPIDAWDSHLHIIDPVRFPLLPDAEYNSSVYTVWDNAIFEHRVGCEHVVMVQPSVYGSDNTLLIESLTAYGPARARGVVVFDNVTAVSQGQLREWHEAGVRGVRINLQTHNVSEPVELLKAELKAHADAIRPFGWVIQMYIPMHLIASLESFIPSLNTSVVFDHFGSPSLPQPSNSPLDPYKLDGFASMVRLLRQGQAWVKISAAYRISKLPGPNYSDVDPIILELFRVAPSRLVYGSDWPHTRYEGLDIQPWVDHLVKLTRGNTRLRRMLFTTNAKRLWQVNNKV